uniref:Uncharacterized protein n=1 Tax=Cacopsylla melanoneura TaxID=428564 RepID=A0A8D8YN81_9HEMI
MRLGQGVSEHGLSEPSSNPRLTEYLSSKYSTNRSSSDSLPIYNISFFHFSYLSAMDIKCPTFNLVSSNSIYSKQGYLEDKGKSSTLFQSYLDVLGSLANQSLGYLNVIGPNLPPLCIRSHRVTIMFVILNCCSFNRLFLFTNCYASFHLFTCLSCQSFNVGFSNYYSSDENICKTLESRRSFGFKYAHKTKLCRLDWICLSIVLVCVEERCLHLMHVWRKLDRLKFTDRLLVGLKSIHRFLPLDSSTFHKSSDNLSTLFLILCQILFTCDTSSSSFCDITQLVFCVVAQLVYCVVTQLVFFVVAQLVFCVITQLVFCDTLVTQVIEHFKPLFQSKPILCPSCDIHAGRKLIFFQPNSQFLGPFSIFLHRTCPQFCSGSFRSLVLLFHSSCFKFYLNSVTFSIANNILVCDDRLDLLPVSRGCEFDPSRYRVLSENNNFSHKALPSYSDISCHYLVMNLQLLELKSEDLRVDFRVIIGKEEEKRYCLCLCTVTHEQGTRTLQSRKYVSRHIFLRSVAKTYSTRRYYLVKLFILLLLFETPFILLVYLHINQTYVSCHLKLILSEYLLIKSSYVLYSSLLTHHVLYTFLRSYCVLFTFLRTYCALHTFLRMYDVLCTFLRTYSHLFNSSVLSVRCVMRVVLVFRLRISVSS